LGENVQSQELGLHHHVNLLYDTPCEVLRETAPYIARGLEANELCVYVTDDDVTPTLFRNALRYRTGIDVSAKERSGQLLVLTYHDAYLKGGTFDQQRMLDTWHQLLTVAVSKGHHGVRAVALGGNERIERMPRAPSSLGQNRSRPASALRQVLPLMSPGGHISWNPAIRLMNIGQSPVCCESSLMAEPR
jgi:hypothetical protein